MNEAHAFQGCAQCWPANADAAWTARSALKEVTRWIDASHFNMRALQCTHCACRFVSIFTERIDWLHGDDEQSWTTVPVTDDEFAQIDASDEGDVDAKTRALPLARRCLRRDHPTGEDAITYWSNGFAIAHHD